ncbi:MAG: ISAzo13 family transposase [Deltaproteobacteria bacterium]|nr:ISAzo13 family transposase [Deltaproteobacteria bacterium]
MDTEVSLSRMFNNVWPHLGERERRLVAAGEARRIGRRGISMVSRACGLSRVTITKGIKELDEAPLAPGKTRRSGAGRPRVERVDPGIWSCLDQLLKDSAGSDGSPNLLWTIKSTRCLAQELTEAQHRISHEKVAQILRQKGYNLQGTRRNDDSQLQPDRKAQFKLLEGRVTAHLDDANPVIAVETKKRDPAALAEDRPPRVESAIDRLLAGEFPTGVYDPLLARETANVETALEAASFTADSILGWWLVEGQDLFPGATCLFVTGDNCGGCQKTAWRAEMQKLSSAVGLPVEFCRFPPGTSKWNRPSQRLFSFVSSHWSGEADRDHEVSTKLINPPEETRTMALGLRLDHSRFQPAARAEGEKGALLNPSEFHGDWNFTINPESFGPYRMTPVFEQALPATSM